MNQITAIVLWKFPFPNTQVRSRRAASALMCMRYPLDQASFSQKARVAAHSESSDCPSCISKSVPRTRLKQRFLPGWHGGEDSRFL